MMDLAAQVRCPSDQAEANHRQRETALNDRNGFVVPLTGEIESGERDDAERLDFDQGSSGPIRVSFYLHTVHFRYTAHGMLRRIARKVNRNRPQCGNDVEQKGRSLPVFVVSV